MLEKTSSEKKWEKFTGEEWTEERQTLKGLILQAMDMKACIILQNLF